MDDFYHFLPDATSDITAPGVLSSVRDLVYKLPFSVLVSIALAPFLIVIATRLLSGRSSEKIAGKDGRSVWLLPYWVPYVGHGFRL